MSLRPYQTHAVEKVLQSFEEVQKVMLQMPTGTGKTEVFSSIIQHHINKLAPGKRVLVLVHTRELVHQIRSRLLKRCGIRSGVILAGHEQEPLRQVQVASIQTLIRRSVWPQNLSLIVIDEAHHTTSQSYRSLLSHYLPSQVKLLGVTATPTRLDGTGFKDLYDKLIVTDTVKKFIEDKWLSPAKHLAVSNLNLSAIPIVKGDYDPGKLFTLMSAPKRIADVVESYLKYGEGRKAIVFAVNQAHNQLLVERFKQDGIAAASIDSNTPKQEREVLLSDFEKGKYKVLCNVQIFTEGFDCPDVGLVILARPTQSLTLYLQMIGRVMRPSPNKEYALILDNAMLWKQHKLVTSDRVWTLAGCKTTNNTVMEIVEKDGLKVAAEMPTEEKGKDFIEVVEEEDEVYNKKGKKVSKIKFRPGDKLRIVFKQKSRMFDVTCFQYYEEPSGKVDLRKYTGRLAGQVGGDINMLLRNGSASILQNRSMFMTVWLNGQNITFPKEGISFAPGRKINSVNHKKMAECLLSTFRHSHRAM